MDRLLALRTFVSVARLRSFSAAARQLRLSATAVSRAIAALEEELGTPLLLRTTRSVSLTQEGAVYLDACQAALDRLDEAARGIRGDAAEPRGGWSSRRRGLRAAPCAADRDAADAGSSAALGADPVGGPDRGASRGGHRRRHKDRRPRRQRSSSSEARGGPPRAGGEPLLSRRTGRAGRRAAAEGHDLIAFDAFTAHAEWRFGPAGGPRSAWSQSSSPTMSRRRSRLPRQDVASPACCPIRSDPDRAGRLRRILPEAEPPAVPVSAVFPANRRSSPNVRAFIEAARQELGACPWGRGRARKHLPASAGPPVTAGCAILSEDPPQPP